MAQSDPLDLLVPFVSRSDHDGVELRLELPALERRNTRIVGFVLAALIPTTVLLLGLPGAALVEWTGWWLVNEEVLVFRWSAISAAICGLLFLGWILQPPTVRIRVDGRRVLVSRPLRRPREIPLGTLNAVLVVVGEGLWLDRIDGRMELVELPVQGSVVLGALRDVIEERLVAARSVAGTAAAVPEQLRKLAVPASTRDGVP